MKIENHSVELISHTPDPEKLIELAGRTCYASTDKMGEGSECKFIASVIHKRGHESVAEHASATFKIITNKYTTQQIERHRLASYSEQSARYCKFTAKKFEGQVSFIAPLELTTDSMLVPHDCWRNSCAQSENEYNQMLSLGCKPEIARSVLNVSMKTVLIATMNFRSWSHFINLRTAKHAQADIRYLAEQVAVQLNSVAPTMFPLCHTEAAEE